MSEISALLVKQLREKTGAGMMDCKKALAEVGGKLEDAVDWLRKKGLAAAAKKSGRVAAEGLVAVLTSGKEGVAVEVNAETDFVARNEQFQALVSKIAEIALAGSNSVDSLKDAAFPGEGGTVSGALTHLISVIGENMNLRRIQKVSVSNGVVTSYMHSATAPNLGKIGVLVALESSAPAEMLSELGKKIAMHIAATQPIALHTEEVDPSLVEREKDISRDKAIAAGRPADIVEKMVEGSVRKFYQDVVLMEQSYIMDQSKRIKDVLADATKQAGTDVTISSFVCYKLGDGIEKEQTDFAAEVMAQAKA